VALVGEIQYKCAILIGTPAGGDILQVLDIDINGIFHIIIGFKICLEMSNGFCCLKIWNSCQ
jgi:hypothetical protein